MTTGIPSTSTARRRRERAPLDPLSIGRQYAAPPTVALDLRRRRIRLGWSIDKMAEMVPCHRNTIQLAERRLSRYSGTMSEAIDRVILAEEIVRFRELSRELDERGVC